MISSSHRNAKLIHNTLFQLFVSYIHATQNHQMPPLFYYRLLKNSFPLRDFFFSVAYAWIGVLFSRMLWGAVPTATTKGVYFSWMKAWKATQACHWGADRVSTLLCTFPCSFCTEYNLHSIIWHSCWQDPLTDFPFSVGPFIFVRRYPSWRPTESCPLSRCDFKTSSMRTSKTKRSWRNVPWISLQSIYNLHSLLPREKTHPGILAMEQGIPSMVTMVPGLCAAVVWIQTIPPWVHVFDSWSPIDGMFRNAVKLTGWKVSQIKVGRRW